MLSIIFYFYTFFFCFMFVFPQQHNIFVHCIVYWETRKLSVMWKTNKQKQHISMGSSFPFDQHNKTKKLKLKTFIAFLIYCFRFSLFWSKGSKGSRVVVINGITNRLLRQNRTKKKKQRAIYKYNWQIVCQSMDCNYILYDLLHFY